MADPGEGAAGRSGAGDPLIGRGAGPIYAGFYGLRESPFALTPETRHLFLSESHQEALASAIYGIQERKGFVLILGEVGTGKTTLVRHLLARFGSDVRTVFVFNPAVTFLELLQIILRDLELPCPALRRVEMIDTLNEYLLKEAAAGRYVVLIIDEAQHLAPGILEEVRMLSNLETGGGKLLQILLVGQPELGDKLGRPELRQLRQRISLVAELQPLSDADTRRYVAHRLEMAGHSGKPIFTRRALTSIYRASRGVPRLINAICDKALVLGYAAGATRVKRKIIRQVLKDWTVFRRRPRARAASARTLRPDAGGLRATLLKGAAIVGVLGVVWGGLALTLTGPRLSEMPLQLWRSFWSAGAQVSTVESSTRGQPQQPSPVRPAVESARKAKEARPSAGTDEAPAVSLPDRPMRQQSMSTRGLPAAAREVPAPEPGRQVVVKAGDIFTALVLRHYGRAEVALLDYVKTANPELTNVDELQVGQRLKLPVFDPRSLVQAAPGAGYRLHLTTVWDAQSPSSERLLTAVDKLGKRAYTVPVTFSPQETAYRVMVGDFADRREAETFYRTFRHSSAG